MEINKSIYILMRFYRSRGDSIVRTNNLVSVLKGAMPKVLTDHNRPRRETIERN